MPAPDTGADLGERVRGEVGIDGDVAPDAIGMLA